MFNEKMKLSIYSIILLTLAACSSKEESPAMELRISRGDLSVAEIARISVEVGIRHGLSANIKDLGLMAHINQDVPVVLIWLNNGAESAITISTLSKHGPILLWFYSSETLDDKEIKNIAKDFEQSFERIKQNKSIN